MEMTPRGSQDDPGSVWSLDKQPRHGPQGLTRGPWYVREGSREGFGEALLGLIVQGKSLRAKFFKGKL